MSNESLYPAFTACSSNFHFEIKWVYTFSQALANFTKRIICNLGIHKVEWPFGIILRMNVYIIFGGCEKRTCGSQIETDIIQTNPEGGTHFLVFVNNLPLRQSRIYTPVVNSPETKKHTVLLITMKLLWKYIYSKSGRCICIWRN